MYSRITTIGKNYLILIVLLLSTFNVIGQVLKGGVYDLEDNSPISFCNIFIPELHLGTRTDFNGKFHLSDLPNKTFVVQFSYTGYSTIQKEIEFGKDENEIDIFLEKHHIELTEIIVSVPGSDLSDDNITPVTKMSIKELNRSPSNNLMESTANLPGVDQSSTGTGIGKPIIRGLSGNRVVTYSQGIRIENQQWGDEHGLGVGSVGIRDVELIKGPNSLLYGSDAIGGVLYFNDEYYANLNAMEAFIQSSFMSNALANQNQAGIKIHRKKYKQNFFGSTTSNADYAIPNGKRVLNTRFDEKNFKTSLGFNNKLLVTNLRYSFLENNYGLTEEDSIYHEGKERSLMLPYQNIKDHKLSSENMFFIGKTKLELILGYTDNTRKEFEDSKDKPALEMKLSSATYTMRYHMPVAKNLHSLIVGAQGMYQINRNAGEEVLIPNANTIDNGFFGIWNTRINRFNVQAGMRVDNRQLNGLETTFGNNERIDAIERSFSNVTYSIGGMYKDDLQSIRLNASSGFRAPNTSELLSDGEHEGSNRYEIGNVDLKSEFANQLDLSYTLFTEHIEFSLNPFYNAIENYIFINPTDSLIEGKQVYNYEQQNAVLSGGEISFHWHPHNIHWLHLESAYSHIIGKSEENENIALIPANNLNSSLKVEFKEKGTFYLSEFFVQHILKFGQYNTAPYEKASPQYNVLNGGLMANWKLGNGNVSFKAGVNNILNTRYIDHLSRLKIYDIPGQGRNVYLSIRFDFSTVFNIAQESVIQEIEIKE